MMEEKSTYDRKTAILVSLHCWGSIAGRATDIEMVGQVSRYEEHSSFRVGSMQIGLSFKIFKLQ